jgi:hypothetical protein
MYYIITNKPNIQFKNLSRTSYVEPFREIYDCSIDKELVEEIILEETLEYWTQNNNYIDIEQPLWLTDIPFLNDICENLYTVSHEDIILKSELKKIPELIKRDRYICNRNTFIKWLEYYNQNSPHLFSDCSTSVKNNLYPLKTSATVDQQNNKEFKPNIFQKILKKLFFFNINYEYQLLGCGDSQSSPNLLLVCPR